MNESKNDSVVDAALEVNSQVAADQIDTAADTAAEKAASVEVDAMLAEIEAEKKAEAELEKAEAEIAERRRQIAEAQAKRYEERRLKREAEVVAQLAALEADCFPQISASEKHTAELKQRMKEAAQKIISDSNADLSREIHLRYGAYPVSMPINNDEREDERKIHALRFLFEASQSMTVRTLNAKLGKGINVVKLLDSEIRSGKVVHIKNGPGSTLSLKR
jgi:hypothetical protein